jgi:RNA-directed DNA polymerase
VRRAKPHCISKDVVWRAYREVRANRGAAGIDGQSIEDFEKDLKNNLYKIWNRMSSGTYFPPAVKRVEIPKDDGKMRKLGIPTVSDRIAQTVAKLYLEPVIEPYFHPDSYAYRPGRSAQDAVEITRRRCWKYDWAIDMDIKGFFDNMCHDRVMKALRAHTSEKWILLYAERWLKAPVQTSDGRCTVNVIGTPQGGVISPLLANLFLHYSMDAWMRKYHPTNPFARYADDAIIHCRTEGEAQRLLECIKSRLAECGLELHPEKTKIVYCKDGKRRQKHPNHSFDFLGFTFRARRAMSHKGVFTSFLPAISGKAVKKIRETAKAWRLQSLGSWRIEETYQRVSERACQPEGDINSPFIGKEIKKFYALDQKKRRVEKQLEQLEKEQETVRQARRSITDCYHPIDTATGQSRAPDELKRILDRAYSELEQVADNIDCSDKQKAKLLKSRKMVPAMVATLFFFWGYVQDLIRKLELGLPGERLLKRYLIPIVYLRLVLGRCKDKDQKMRLRETLSNLEIALEADPDWALAPPSDKEQLQVHAMQCAEVFQRSSSCVEGRNGQLSLRHHAHRSLSDRRLEVLTIIHNYGIIARDGTTPAERFFEQKQKCLFNYLLNGLAWPLRPRKAWTKLARIKSDQALAQVAVGE